MLKQISGYGFLNRHRLLRATLSLLVLVGWLIAYQPVMFNFLVSDDFYVISGLHSAQRQPGILLTRMDEATPYFRPLSYCLLFFEYLIVGKNGFALRTISLGLELLTIVALAFLIRQLVPTSSQSIRSNVLTNWCLFSAGLFLLYLLHTEPINWFICTNDLLVTLFILLTCSFYVYWRKTRNIFFEIISCIFAACALLTKEHAVIIPMLLILYELLLNTNEKRSKNILGKIMSSIIPTTNHWIILAAYLILRKIFTGYFFGNPGNISFNFYDVQNMLHSWMHSLKIILVPVSSALSFSQPLGFLWELLICCLTGLTIYTTIKSKHSKLLMSFMAGWFAISLLPVLKFFVITPDLLNDRFGYLASIPLCCFLAYGLVMLSTHKVYDRIIYFSFLAMIIVSCFILRANNLAWAETGQLTNNLLKGFAKIHKDLRDKDYRIYYVNIPYVNKGVPVNGLNVIGSMNQIPFSDTNYKNAI